MKRVSLRAKLLVGFAVPIALMTVWAVIRYWAVGRTLESADWVAHTYAVIAEGNELEVTLARLVSSDAPPGAEDAELVGLDRRIVKLEAEVADNRDQVARLERFGERFRQWNASRRQGAPDPALAEEARRAIQDFVAHERRILAARNEANADASHVVRLTGVLLPAAAILIALMAAVAISGRIGRRMRALAATADALADGDLERRVRVSGDDELAALAIAFNKMADRLAERSRQTELLAELAEGMQTSADMQEASAIAERLLTKAAGESSGGVTVFNASRNLLTRAFTWGKAPAGGAPLTAETLQPEECLALRRGKTQLVRDVARDGTCKHLGAKHGSTLCVPLLAHGETVGVMSIVDERTSAWTGEVATLFQTIGEQLGVAFANLQLRTRLQNQSIRDPLTSLFNRRYLEETFVRELARASRGDRNVGVLVLDVDHFKRFNDSFGHDAGDAVLRSVGGLLRSSARDSDIPCRFGGEEFVIVFPDIDLETLTRRAERVREAVKALSISHRGQAVGPITISIGAAITPSHGATPDALLAAADKALYEAKASGRDRVIVAPTTQATIPLFSLAPSPLRRTA